MLASSFKAKIQRILIKEGFQKSKKSKGRVIDNHSAGFTFDKYWEDEFYLYYTSGNMAFRGMSTEEKDSKTMKMYNRLVELGYEDNLEISEVKNQVAILLKPNQS